MVDVVNPFLPKPLYLLTAEGVKVARPDIIVEDKTISSDSMAELIFQDIGGHEFLAQTRSDTVNSPLNIAYRSIKNQGEFNQLNNPSKLSIPTDIRTSSSMNIFNYIDGENGIYTNNDGQYSLVERTNQNGSTEVFLEISLVNISKAERVQVQLYGFDNAYSDTMY